MNVTDEALATWGLAAIIVEVRDKERERCAKIAEDLVAHLFECGECGLAAGTFDPPTVIATARVIADYIRTKGE